MRGAIANTLERPEAHQADFAMWEAETQPGARAPLGDVVVIPETAEDLIARTEAQILIARAAGQAAVSKNVEIGEVREQAAPSAYKDLQTAIEYASRGDKTARKVVETNAATDVIERSIKAGHSMRVTMHANDYGKLVQHGQLMEDVYVNSLKFASATPGMRARAEAETRNGSRIELYNRQGLLKDYYFVVISRAADDMSPAEAAKAGFFTDTQSCAIQVTYQEGGQLVTESHFVAGVKKPGQPRHDHETVARLGDHLGVNLRSKNATQTIDTPFLVHKSMLAGGAIDMVKLYDQAAGGTFYGEDRPAQNYQKYLAECRRREAEMQPMVQAIVDTLLSEADQIRTPRQATQRLHELSQRYLVDRAITDKKIDLRVFGAEAMPAILAAREAMQMGDTAGFMAAREQAQKTAKTSSCPTGDAGNGKGGASGSSDGESSGESAQAGSKEKDPSAHKQEIHCPECDGNFTLDSVEERENRSEERVAWHCPGCDLKVDICTNEVWRLSLHKKGGRESMSDIFLAGLQEMAKRVAKTKPSLKNVDKP